MPVYCAASIAELPRVYVIGGKRGYIVSMRAEDLTRVLRPVLLSMAQ
jgi:prolyl-tRNA editing enzyme YbaK/EbsC (Cys-tRNA(Pro) deacylase)